MARTHPGCLLTFAGHAATTQAAVFFPGAARAEAACARVSTQTAFMPTDYGLDQPGKDEQTVGQICLKPLKFCTCRKR